MKGERGESLWDRRKGNGRKWEELSQVQRVANTYDAELVHHLARSGGVGGGVMWWKRKRWKRSVEKKKINESKRITTKETET